MTSLLLLGDYSGRNTGHNAHLLSACNELRQTFGSCEILVPTLSPKFIQPLCSPFDDIKLFGVAPWHGSLKFFGPPMLSALKRSQALILADNMFYDNHLYHPLKNNLLALFWLVKAAKKHSIPVIYFNAGVGPARHNLGRSIIRQLAHKMDLILLRDSESADLLHQLTGITNRPIAADSGFNMPWQALGTGSSDAEPDLVGVNLSHHLQRWQARKPDECQLDNVANALQALAARSGKRLIFIVSHPTDLAITEEVASRIKNYPAEIWQEDGLLVQQIATDIHRFAWVLGTRYHEIILFASAGVPVFGLDCGEKLDGLFATMKCSSNLLATDSLSSERGIVYLQEAVKHALSETSTFRARVQHMASRGLEGAAKVRQIVLAHHQSR